MGICIGDNPGNQWLTAIFPVCKQEDAEEKIQHLFDEFDEDKSGSVNAEEIRDALQKMNIVSHARQAVVMRMALSARNRSHCEAGTWLPMCRLV